MDKSPTGADSLTEVTTGEETEEVEEGAGELLKLQVPKPPEEPDILQIHQMRVVTATTDMVQNLGTVWLL